jgi:hypothetical protein
MEVEDNGSLSITELGGKGGNGGDRPPRVTIPEGTYEAEYRGFKVFMDKTPWDNLEKKVCRLMFKVSVGPQKDQITSYKKIMVKTNDGRWVVGGKTDLAEAIRTVTGGTDNLTPEFVGRRFFIKVKNKKSKTAHKETGLFNTYDFVDTVLQMPSTGIPAPAPVQTQTAAVATNGAAAKAQLAPTAAGNGGNKDSGLLDDLSELSDFEKF